MGNIALFGDSITWGSWDPIGGGWAGRLWSAICSREEADADIEIATTQVFNRGIPGDRLIDLASRFDVEATAIQPAVVVLAIGINDSRRSSYPGTPLDMFETGYNLLIDKAFAMGCDVVVVTPTNVDESRREHDYANDEIVKFTETIRHIAEQRQLAIVDTFGTMTPQDLAPDGLHPGPEGHEKLFQLIDPIVSSRPALNDPR